MFSVAAPIDLAVTTSLYALATASPVFSFLAVFVAQWLPYCAIIFVVLYEFVVDEDERTVIPARLRHIFIPVLAALLLVVGMKFFIHEPRPFVGEMGITPLVSVVDPFRSFPSAHAAVFSALFGALFVYRVSFWKWYGVIALAVAAGRIATGVHWASDVFFGLLLGFVVAFVWGRVSIRRQEKNI